MSDGFSVFDTEARLITSNAKSVNSTILPAAAAAPGTPLNDILEAFRANGAEAFDPAGRPVPLGELHDTPASRTRQYEISPAPKVGWSKCAAIRRRAAS